MEWFCRLKYRDVPTRRGVAHRPANVVVTVNSDVHRSIPTKSTAPDSAVNLLTAKSFKEEEGSRHNER